MSRKFVRCWFVSAVMLRPSSLNFRMRSFFAFSDSLMDFVFRTAKPSSRYKPASLPNSSWSEFNMNKPISSHISIY